MRVFPVGSDLLFLAFRPSYGTIFFLHLLDNKMKEKVLLFFCAIGRFIFSLRYRFEVKGLELLNKEHLNRKGGVLFLPNHPAHIDPILIVLNLWPKFHMRPLVIEYVYRQAFVHTFMKLVNALPIPNFETSINELKLKKAQESLDVISKGLKKKQNFLLYPSGRLKHTGKEILGGASAAHSLVQENPDTNIVMIRTTGLWGSRFSRAITGTFPDFTKNFLKGFWILLKNGIFFTPRRKVTIEILPNPKDFPFKSSRLEFNRYLEDWFNQYTDEKGKTVDTEPLSLISYSHFSKEVSEVMQVEKKKKGYHKGKISPKMQKEIVQEIAKISEHGEGEVKLDMNLALDLGFDSLDIAQLVGFLNDHYDVGEIHPEDLETVRDVMEMAEMKRKTERVSKVSKGVKWPKEKGRYRPDIPCGKTIQEAFLRSCDRMGKFAACGDDIVGVLSYAKLKKASLVLAQRMKKMPSKHIAIMLPASCAAYIVILACLLADKIPVMLNWTLGPRYLNEMMKATGSKVVISSWKFLERLSYVEFGELTDKFQLLEDIKKDLTLGEKLRGVFLSMKSAYGVLRSMGLYDKKEDQIAVILFTSGTEAVPKGVPLSHKNLLSNQAAALQCVNLHASDTIFGILPPSHSFGFSVAGILPLLVGMRVAFYPDPTDSFALAEGIPRWNITLFCSAPSFLKGVLSAASKKDLEKVRLFVSGAEKAPPELFDKVKKIGKKNVLIEGYGITECSPMLTLNRPSLPPAGVGQLIPGIEFTTIHPETKEPLHDPHKEGEICVRGPNVFKGYLGDEKSPFIEAYGKQWYCTGDLGYMDEQGNVILFGRLKRFAKIGGEMISLGGIEEVVAKALLQGKQGDEDSGPFIAVCADEKEAKSSIILFTTLDLDKKDVNEILKNAGFSRLVKIAAIKKLEEIPILGTGKTDYRSLQKMIEENGQ